MLIKRRRGRTRMHSKASTDNSIGARESDYAACARSTHANARGIGGGRRGRGNARFDQKAFEPNVKEYDQMLNKMHGICKGC